MFARVTPATVPVDRLDDAIELFRKTALPSYATSPGYLGGLMLVDRQAGKVLAATYWQDEASLRGSDEMASAARAQASQASGAQVGQPERFEIVLMERVVTPRPNVFVRVNDVRGSAERLEDGIRLGREQVLPLVRTLPGWLAIQMAVNRQNGRALLMTIWDTPAHRETSEAAVRQMRAEAGQTIGAGSVEVSLYEAVVVELNPAAFPVGASAKMPA